MPPRGRIAPDESLPPASPKPCPTSPRCTPSSGGKLSGEPYLAHLLAVAAIVMEHGGNEDEAIAALLHDAVEDQGGLPTLEEIRRRFGPAVAEIVEGCSDAVVTPKPPWRQRKEAYIARLRNASASVRLVSAADKLHNARSHPRASIVASGESLWANFRGGRDGTLWYYRTVVETLKQAAANRSSKNSIGP